MYGKQSDSLSKAAYSLGVFKGVLVSLIRPQRGQAKRCATVLSPATRTDRDQFISMLHAVQTGAVSPSID